jgi:hypothetical protein
MTETQGLIAGFLLFFALFVYTFWPQNVLANSARTMPAWTICWSARNSSSEDLRDLNFEFQCGQVF